MKKILLSVFVTLLCNVTFSQSTSVNLNWANSIGSSANDILNSSTTDAAGNFYITGMVSSSLDFDPSPSTTSLNAATSAYVAKYSAAGALIWAKVFSGSYTGEGRAIGVDGGGNVYVAGRYNYGDINLDPSASNFTLAAQGNAMFVSKYSSAGTFVWGYGVGINSDYVKPEGMSVDAAGNIILVGTYNPSPTVNFNPAGTATNIASYGNFDGFVAKYNSSFLLQWVSNYGDNMNDYCTGVTTDASNNIYVVGNYQTQVDLDPTATNSICTSQGLEDGFVAKYSPSGSLIWGGTMGGSQGDAYYKIALDNSGHVITCGYALSTTFDTDLSSPATNILTKVGAGGVDVVLGKYVAATGALVWAQTTGGSGDVFAYNLTSDSQANIYLTGSFIAPTDFDFSASNLNLTPVSSAGATDVFLSKYDPFGATIYAHQIGGGSLGNMGAAVSVNSNNDILLLGSHSYPVDIDFSATNTLVAYGGSDLFFVNYNQCIDASQPTLAVISQTICANGVATLSVTGGSLNSATNWVWYGLACGTGSFATGTTATVAPILANNTYYVDGEGGCTNAGPCTSASVTVLPSKNITGTVSASSVAVPGKVQLFRYEGPLTKWDSVTYQLVNAAGEYTFTSVNSGSYIIMCIPTSTAYVKTYAPNNPTWKNSTVFSHGCATGYTINIDVVPIMTLTPGPGVLAGKIVEGINYGGRSADVTAPGSPIGGLSIKGGKNPGGNIVAQGRTDGSGGYTLTGLPISAANESYYVFVDIPGVDTLGTHHVAITTASTMYTDLDFVVDSDYVKPVDYTGIKELKLAGEKVKVYPNPARDLVYIQTDAKNGSDISLELYDLFGKKILSENYYAVQSEFKTSIDVGKLNRGVYFVKLRLNSGEARIKLVVSE